VIHDGRVYYASSDGRFLSVPVAGGASSLVYQGASIPDTSRLVAPRLVGVGGDDVFLLDAPAGDVVRAPRAGGQAALFASGIEDAQELLVDERAVYVVAERPPDEKGLRAGDRVVMLDRSTGAELNRWDFSHSGVEDIAATRAALYVSLGGVLYRLPKAGGAARTVFAEVPEDFYALRFTWRTLRVEALAATENRLFFTTQSRIFVLREGDAWPTVLATGSASASQQHVTDLVADDDAVFMSNTERGMGGWRTEVGRVTLPGHDIVDAAPR